MSCTSCKQTLQQGINIIKGITNTVIKSEETENLHDKRIPICEGCEFKLPLIKVNNKQHYYCTICTCACSLKVRVINETCPKGKW